MKTPLTALAALALGCAATAVMAAGTSITINGTPTPGETAAIRHALGKDYAEMSPYTVGHADLNGDHKPDLIIRSGNSDYCGSGGCATAALLATATGYQGKSIDLAYSASDLIVLPAIHKGMHDIRFDGGSHQFVWTGTEYR
jgi:hypothetical protein